MEEGQRVILQFTRYIPKGSAARWRADHQNGQGKIRFVPHFPGNRPTADGEMWLCVVEKTIATYDDKMTVMTVRLVSRMDAPYIIGELIGHIELLVNIIKSLREEEIEISLGERIIVEKAEQCMQSLETFEKPPSI